MSNMNRIKSLISRFCPNGVEYKKLGEIGTFTRGSGIQKKDFVEDGKPCIHYGQVYTYYGLSASETKSFISDELYAGRRKANKDDLIIATTSENEEDVCKCVAWLGNEPCAVSGDAYIFSHEQDPKYLAYLFCSDKFQEQKKRYITGTKVLRVSGDDMAKIELPFPPLDIQHEIVRILDSFVDLEAELEAELEARRMQYTYYRDQLLSRENLEIMASTTIGLRPLSDVLEMKAGIHIPASKIHSRQTDESPYPCYGGNGLRGYVASPNQNGDKILIGRQGALCGNICAVSGHFYATEHAIVSTCSNELLPRYAFHMLTNANLNQYKSQGAQPGLAVGNLKQVEFPIPPLPVQQRVVDILDRFDALTSSLTDGLPAEIEARRRQYEYYRDRLLDFPRKEADS